MIKIERIVLILFVILEFSCNSQLQTDDNQDIKSQDVYIDTPFVQEYHEGYLVDVKITESNDVRAIQPDRDGNIWIAAKSGVYLKAQGSTQWELMISGSDQGPAYDVEIDGSSIVWIAAWNGIYSNLSGKLEKMKGPKPPLAKVVIADEGVYTLGPYGIWLYQNNSWEKKNYSTARSMRAAVSDGKEGIWIGTDVGLYHCNDEKTSVYQDQNELISAYVRGLDFNDQGELWVGCLGGITIRNVSGKIDEKKPADGVTNAWVNVVKRSPDGTMWIGTNYGITRFTPGSDDYSVRLSRRWLMSDEVNDIAFDKNGNAWIATTNGVSAIKKREMTLAQKADFFYQKLIQRHVREPWIVNRFRLNVPGDTTTIEASDDDNDGEYTAMYLAMESFRYAVTKEPEAREGAKKAFEFLHYLREVTEMDGFFARTIIPVSWERSHDMNRTYTPQELAEEIINNPRQKPVEKRWHLSKDKKWMWKGDTSSDELDGHLFGYYCYYNFVADEKEKERVADHFTRIMDHLMRNDFNLVGVDGKHTKWGVWSPQILNQDPEWAPERALNSLELLAFLKFAYQISGDEKYQKAYLKLIYEDGYIENAKMLHNTNPAWETYFDIYLALYVYPPLLLYEDDPAIKSEYQTHLHHWFEKHKETNSPLVNFMYNYLTGGKDELENSIFFLKDAPLDLVDWQIDNGRREDLQVVREPVLEELQVDELRPPSEYRTIRWDRNPYASIGGNPAQERDPVYWLLPYWMGRYLKVISTDTTSGQDHTLTGRKFQGIPSLAISPEGRLWATWYAGITPGEDQNNYVVISSSGDSGKTWKENLIIDPDAEGPLRAFDPELWIDPEGRLWSFWAQTIGHDGKIAGLWARINEDPDKVDSNWLKPRRLTDGIMMCKPTVLSSGEWILPASTWRDTDNSARIMVTTDKGQTFKLRGACNVPVEVRSFDEQMIIERKDKSLWMLVRTSYGIGESISNDRGKTWSALEPSSIQHPSARFFIRRLNSGNLLLIKHGPISKRTERSHLTAYVSDDDGRTWSNGLLLDERSGVSYPDGQQSQDGTIHIIYDYSRTGAREILMATFTENDAETGNPASSTVSLRMVVSKFPELENQK